MEGNGKVMYLAPPMRPLAWSIPTAWVGGNTPYIRACALKNTVFDQSGDENKFGSGKYHMMSSEEDGAHVRGFAEVRTK